jgi:hypothetical protein
MVQLITDRDDVNRIQKRLERTLRKGGASGVPQRNGVTTCTSA